MGLFKTGPRREYLLRCEKCGAEDWYLVDFTKPNLDGQHYRFTRPECLGRLVKVDERETGKPAPDGAKEEEKG